jgi:integrase
MIRKINKRTVDVMQVGESVTDTEIKGFNVRMLPSGKRTYGLAYRHNGKSRWLAIGIHGAITPDQARQLAKKHAGEIAAGRDPQQERETARARVALTVAALADEWLARAVRGKLRTARAIELIIDRHIRPTIGALSALDIKRGDIIRMLDKVEAESGAPMADRVLAWTSRIFSWSAVRNDAVRTPITRGMRRSSVTARARTRVLSDIEVRALWRATDGGGPYDAAVRFALCTAARRNEIAGLHRSELDELGTTWVLPAARSKNGRPFALPLSDLAQDILAARPAAGFVFGPRDKPLSGFARHKALLDAAMVDELRRRSHGRAVTLGVPRPAADVPIAAVARGRARRSCRALPQPCARHHSRDL